jgi:hypothetical protein
MKYLNVQINNKFHIIKDNNLFGINFENTANKREIPIFLKKKDYYEFFSYYLKKDR